MRGFRFSVSVLLSLVIAACASYPPQSSVPPVANLPSPASEVPPPPEVIEHGKASYYADNFEGRMTASGERLDQNALTAASKNLPIGTKAVVTNLKTGQSVEIEINDRGPYVRGRVIDLSKRAASQIGITDGVTPVKIVARAADQPTPALKEEIVRIAAHKAKRTESVKAAAAADIAPQ